MKRFFAVLLYLCTLSAFACDSALPTDHENFCASFKAVAICHCISSGVPSSMCQNMDTLYNRMITVFGSLQRACEYQKHTTPQDCMDTWNCYRLGGKDSKGKPCSGTTAACR